MECLQNTIAQHHVYYPCTKEEFAKKWKAKNLGPKNFFALRKPEIFSVHILFFKLILGGNEEHGGGGVREERPGDDYNISWIFEYTVFLVESQGLQSWVLKTNSFCCKL